MSRDDQTINATLRIQRAYRNHIHRQKMQRLNPFLRFSQPISEQSDYPALFAGNGPETISIPPDRQLDSPFVLIGVCCLQAIKIAAKLCTHNQFDFIKRIIILDNSKNVIAFWKLLQAIFADSFNQTILMKKLHDTEQEWEIYGRGMSDYNDQIYFSKDFLPISYSFDRVNRHGLYKIIEELSAEVGFSKLKKLVLETFPIACDLTKENDELFDNIRIWCETRGFQRVAYTSNVFAVINHSDNTTANQFIRNFTKLNPIISIFLNARATLSFNFTQIGSGAWFPCDSFIFSGMPTREIIEQHLVADEKKKNEMVENPLYQTISGHLKGSFEAFFQNQFSQAAQSAKEAYDFSRTLMSQNHIGDAFLLHVVIARILGFALLKINDEAGRQYLSESLAYLRALEGDTSSVRAFESEIESHGGLVASDGLRSPFACAPVL